MAKLNGVNKIPRFMLRGPQLCTIFCFVLNSCTVCINQITKTFPLASSSDTNTTCVVCMVKAKEMHKNIQQKKFVRLYNHPPLLTLKKINSLLLCVFFLYLSVCCLCRVWMSPLFPKLSTQSASQSKSSSPTNFKEDLLVSDNQSSIIFIKLISTTFRFAQKASGLVCECVQICVFFLTRYYCWSLSNRFFSNCPFAKLGVHIRELKK